MFSAGPTPPLIDLIDIGRLRVQSPQDIIFVCGGPTEIDMSKPPPSFRELFMRTTGLAKGDHTEIVLAEQFTAQFSPGLYSDFLTFENDLAQVCLIVVLFSESAGSFTELGAFASSDDISQRLLVFIDDGHHEENSFIKLGPLAALQKEQGESSVAILNRAYLGIEKITNIKDINTSRFTEVVDGAIQNRIGKIKHQHTFDPNRRGHTIKFFVALIQLHGALELDEIFQICIDLDIDISISNCEMVLSIGILLEWVGKNYNGQRVFYYPKIERTAATLNFKKESGYRVMAYKADVRDHYEANDPQRFAAIKQAIREAIT